ncbi:hypothetical protein MHTCC0001_10270 [Flavobacteriaceae bacterium MHTCC 0001]
MFFYCYYLGFYIVDTIKGRGIELLMHIVLRLTIGKTITDNEYELTKALFI